MKLTAAEIYAALRRAGFSAPKAVTMTAVALGESRGQPWVLGDTSLTDAKWGPSVGLFQIRTLKAETGRGTHRDIERLRASIQAQAAAAHAISSGGSNFAPWTVFTSGRYRNYLAQAQQGARVVGDRFEDFSVPGWAAATDGGLAGLVPGFDTAGITRRIQDVAAESLFALAGIVLVALGATVAVRSRFSSHARAREAG